MFRRYLLGYALGGTAFFVLGPLVQAGLGRLFSTPLTGLPGLNTIAGAVLILGGLYFCLAANYELIVRGRGGGAVVGPVKLTPETRLLVTSGVYARCRHPMHFGLVIFYLGIALLLDRAAALAVPLLMFCFALFTALVFDEPRLKRDFGAEFEAYRQRVPFFWPRFRV